MKKVINYLVMLVFIIIFSIVMALFFTKTITAISDVETPSFTGQNFDTEASYYFDNMVARSDFMCGQHPSWLKNKITPTVKVEVTLPGGSTYSKQTTEPFEETIWDISTKRQMITSYTPNVKLTSIQFTGAGDSGFPALTTVTR